MFEPAKIEVGIVAQDFDILTYYRKLFSLAVEFFQNLSVGKIDSASEARVWEEASSHNKEWHCTQCHKEERGKR